MNPVHLRQFATADCGRGQHHWLARAAFLAPDFGRAFVFRLSRFFKWDERYGDLVIGRHNYQILAGVLALSNLALVGLMVWFVLHSKVIPYVVEVDKLGYALAMRAPNAAPGGADAADRMVRYELAAFIRNARSVSSDRGSEQQMLQSVLSHSHAAASGFLNAYYHSEKPPHNPFKISEHQTVSVQIDSILSLSRNSWQCAGPKSGANSMALCRRLTTGKPCLRRRSFRRPRKNR